MERCRRVVCTVRQWFWGETYVPIRSSALIASRCALTTSEEVDQDVRALSALASHFVECELNSDYLLPDVQATWKAGAGQK